MKRAVGITRILLVAAIALLAGVSGARAQAGSATLNVMDRLEDSQFNGATINNCAFEVGDMLYVRVQLGPVVPGPGPQPPDMRITVRANGPAGVEDTETMTLRFFTEFPGASQNYWYAGFMPTARRPDNRPGFPWALTGNGTLELRGRNYIDFPDVNFIYPGATWTYINPAREIPAHCGAKLRFVRQDAFLPAPRQDNVTIPGELGLFPIGDTLYALLEDDDLNTDPASSQDVALGGGGGSTPPNVNPLPYLSDGAGPTAIPPADQEFFSGALQLHETGPDTGVFMSSIPSRFTVPTVFTSGNGVLEKTGYTAGNATVQFVYSDAHYPQTDRGNNVTVPQNNLTLVTLTRLITVERGATPTFTGTDANLALGQPFKIVVSDGGLNQPNSAVSEAVTVRAISYTDATQTTILDEETVVLGNTGTPSFAGQIRWVYQSPVVATTQRDGVLTVPRLGAAGTIRLYYYTPVGPDGEPYFRVTTTAGLAAVAAGASPEFLTREDVWASPLGAAPNNRVAPTDTLCVRINDPGLVTQPFPGTNTVTVTVDSNVHPNPQVLTAHEVATRPGWFIAQVPLSWGNPSLAPDGTLHVRGADLITAAYTDSFGNPQSAGNLPQVATAGAVTIREDPLTNTLPQPGDGGELKQLQAGQTFNIVVVDDDQNATAGIDQITGLAALRIQTYDQAYAGLELATTTLFETGPDTGVFTGRVSTRWATAATGVAGTVSVQGRSGTNNVSVTYIDPFPLTATASSSAGAEVAAGVTGLVALLPSPLYPGGSLTISVVDTDGWANVRPGPGNDTIQVTLTAYNSLSAVFDTQVVEVPEVPAEAGGTGGSFYMVVPTAFATVGVAADGVLQVTAGGSIRMGYVDAVTATGQTNAVVMATATVLYNPAAVVSVQFARDLNGTVYTGPIAPGDTLYIRVSDSNANVSGGIDSTTIDVTTRFDLLPAGLAGGFCDIETVRLEETGPNTGLVTGQIDSKFAENLQATGTAPALPYANIVLNNGQLEVRGRDPDPGASQLQIRAGYSHPLGTTTANMAVNQNARVSLVTPDSAQTGGRARLYNVTAGDRLYLVVEDDDANYSPTVLDMVTVRVTSTDGVTTVDTELVTLTETGLNTGVFTNAGGLPSHYTLLAPDTIANDLGIRAGSGGQIQLGYFDLETTTAIATNRVELLPVNVGVTAVLITSPANGGNLNPSQNVSIAVYDNDVWANRSPGAGNDTVTVTMTSFTGGLGTIVVDQEVIQVPEDRLVAGVFQRWMPAEFVPNNTNPGFADGTRYDDGRIQVRLGGSVEVRYNDPVNVSGNVPLYSTATSAISNVFTAAFRLAGPANPILFVSDTFVPLSGPTSYVNRQVTAVGPGDTVNVSVTDPDFDLTPDVDTLLVAIASRTTNAAGPVVPPFTTAMDDLEWMPLTETGPRTGVFAGSMKTVIAPDAFSTVLRNNGNLEVRGHDFSSAGGSEPQVTAAYTDARAALQTRQLAVNIDGTVRFVENPRVADSAAALPGFQESPGAHLPGQISEIKAGEPLYLQLIDDDLNRDASTTDPVLPATLTVTVRSYDNGALFDTEPVALRETGSNTGIFMYDRGAFANGFRAGFPTAWRPAAGATPSNGILELRASGTDNNAANPITSTNYVTVDYGDGETRLGVPVSRSDRISIRKGVTGTLTMADRLAGGSTAGTRVTNGGDDLYITVTGETDCSTAPGPGNDTLTVTLTSTTAIDGGGTRVDSEVVILTEDPTIEGDFSGTFPSSYYVPAASSFTNNNGRIEVVPGGSVAVSYTDNLGPNGEPFMRTPAADGTGNTLNVNVETATVAFVDSLNAAYPTQPPVPGAALPTPLPVARIAPGDTLYIRVQDRDADVVPLGHTNTVTVNVTTTSTGDSELVVCRETTTPGVFVGEIQTRFGLSAAATGKPNADATIGNGIVEVRGRDRVYATYREGTAPVVDVEFAARLRVQENLSAEAGELTTVPAGTDLVVRLVDDDVNASAGVSEQVTVTATIGIPVRDTEYVLLTETGPDTGIFTGKVPVRSRSTATSYDGYLDAPLPGANRIETAFINLTYRDYQVPYPVVGTTTYYDRTQALDLQYGQDLAPETGRVEIHVPFRGVYTRPNDLAQLIAGAPMCMVVYDRDADVSPARDVATVTISVTTTAQGSTNLLVDQEVLRLSETELSSGVFKGCIETNFGPRQFGDNKLSVAGNEYVSVTYTDPNDALGQRLDVTDQVRVAPKYLSEVVANNVSTKEVVMDLSNGARVVIPAYSVYKPLDVKFQLRYGVPIQTGGDSRPIDESGNYVPLPLNPAIQLLQDQGKAFWYELQPSAAAFKKPVQMFIPVPTSAHISGAVPPLNAQQLTQIKVVFFDGYEWLSIGGSFRPRGSDLNVPDPQQDYVVASTNHLTTYALAVDTRSLPPIGGPLVSSVAANNNPFTPNADSFNDTTTVSFALAEPSMVNMRIFDSNGDVVRTLIQDVILSSGYVSEQWDGSYLFAERKVPSGLYVVEIKATSITTGRKAKETLLVGVMK